MRDRCTACNKWRDVAPLAQSPAPLTDNGYGGSGQYCCCCRLQELLPWDRRHTGLFRSVRTFTSILGVVVAVLLLLLLSLVVVVVVVMMVKGKHEMYAQSSHHHHHYDYCC